MNSPLKLGRWIVEPQFNRIRRDHRLVYLEPKVMNVLLCLARRPGQVMRRSDLRKEVWGEVNVVDGVLGRTIYELRKALRSLGESADYLKTVPKVGYCLDLPVRSLRGRRSRAIRLAKSPYLGWATTLLLLPLAIQAWIIMKPAETSVWRSVETPLRGEKNVTATSLATVLHGDTIRPKSVAAVPTKMVSPKPLLPIRAAVASRRLVSSSEVPTARQTRVDTTHLEALRGDKVSLVPVATIAAVKSVPPSAPVAAIHSVQPVASVPPAAVRAVAQ